MYSFVTALLTSIWFIPRNQQADPGCRTQIG
jgi:hypothetical protein